MTTAQVTSSPAAVGATPPVSGPWWRYGHVWMVIGGPLVVVVASFVTLWLAVSTPDPVYTEADLQALPPRGVEQLCVLLPHQLQQRRRQAHEQGSELSLALA